MKFLKSSSATGADQGNLYLVKPKSAAKPMERLERLKLPEHKFKTMGEALGYLFKRLPLWSPEAKQSRYKRTYPFCACSEKEFMSWNIGKKLSAEVSCFGLFKDDNVVIIFFLIYITNSFILY